MAGRWVVSVVGLAACLVAGLASAAEPSPATATVQPTVLTLAQMDSITAGGHEHERGHCRHYAARYQRGGWGPLLAILNRNISGGIVQINNNMQIAIVIGNNNTVTQVAVLTNVVGM